MTQFYQACPLCSAPVDFNRVYPHSLCHTCITEAKDDQGEPLTFFHSVFVPGGLQVYHRENKELIPFPAKLCYVKEVMCTVKYDADYGIVVQPFFPSNAQFREDIRLQKQLLSVD